ncbi:MAG TPA: glucoamylase family protein, partial [bacterium]|nr:glucoamylase family protein [bacterium]
DYFENSRRATLAQQAYCIANPKGWKGYSAQVWGLTASDGPDGYAAHGAPPPQEDDGTIAPTAAGGSLPFAPEICLPTLHYFYDAFRQNLWGAYGFRDAFNLTRNWWDTDVIGIDQGPIALMIENYRSGRVWKTFMKNADIRRGLERAGFRPTGTGVDAHPSTLPQHLELEQNYPNPFNNATMMTYTLPRTGRVSLMLYDVQGRMVHRLVDSTEAAGVHHIILTADRLASGIYFYRLVFDGSAITRKLQIIK